MPYAQIVFWLIAGCLSALAAILLLRPLGAAVSGGGNTARLAIVGLVPLAALGLYLTLGRPELIAWRTRPKLPPFIAASVAKLTQEAHDNPTDIQAWLLLGDVYAKIERYGEAEDAYRRAAALDAANLRYKAMVGQMLVMEKGGAVSGNALTWFNQAKADPVSRYYLALAKSQAGDWKGALADWQTLEKDLPEDGRSRVDADIAEARQALGLDEHLR